jgi:glutamate-1-semialdehyde 2,1-aminomutase
MMGQLWFSSRPPRDYREGQQMIGRSPFPVLYAEFRKRGVIVQPPQEGLFFISSAHSDDDIARTIAIAEEAMPEVARAVAEGRVGPPPAVR